MFALGKQQANNFVIVLIGTLARQMLRRVPLDCLAEHCIEICNLIKFANVVK